MGITTMTGRLVLGGSSSGANDAGVNVNGAIANGIVGTTTTIIKMASSTLARPDSDGGAQHPSKEWEKPSRPTRRPPGKHGLAAS
ncbi:hypothetical protein CBM2598_U10091 [Cupriavidus taiwanensis]|uniref:Uncharacterized protein n=1 Tax=Cupriavidus taiwanensis TaxID=164546 RepID=A0A7Z7JFQ8_9BURK|nr:hypothetical protein CBM2597_U10260 [Cupriavidus taiwanensis]SOZ96270.1 hypothetical protein CBM2598_U10091 [Cupriavidus taiwanensis]SPC25765.1 hypothetical protein CBM2594_U10266 [Cupriavidus taiwanensis]